MDKHSIFKLWLWLEEPRYIEWSELVDGILNIKINFKEWSRFYDESTKEYYGVYRTNTRKLKHLFMRQYETILEVRMPEIKTNDGHIKVIKFPLADKWSQFTYLFEWMILEFCKDMPVSKVAILVKEHFNTIMRIVDIVNW
jgi:formylmethanofuran dehydrogenase subunit A